MLDQKNNKRSQKQRPELPPIPDKVYFTIGEVSQLCNLQPHVLRYWEQEFPRLKPTKRSGNRRSYQHKDVLLIREIMALLYEQGFTIAGARSKLANAHKQKVNHMFSYHLMKETIGNLETVLAELEA
jgi:DNA-binding transcriptional MerR regulator